MYAIAAFARILSWERVADGTRAQRAYAARDANVEWFPENVVNS